MALSNGVTPRTSLAPKPAAKVSKLGDVKQGTLATAKRFCFYGTRGIGKSTLAADAPSPIFIDLGNGTEHLNVARYPLQSEPTYRDILDAIDDIGSADHAYKTLVIEDLGELESMMWKHIVETTPAGRDGDRPSSIEGFGFGKGYVLAEAEWRVLVHRLDQLRLKRNMHVVLLGHSTIVSQKNPGGENYDRHVPMIHAKAAGVISGNTDVVGFVTFDDVAKRIQSGPAKKVVGVTGHRVIHLEHSATWDAKCRLPLPSMIDLQEESPWKPFEDAVRQLTSTTPEALRRAIDVELKRLGDTFTKADGGIGKADAVREAVQKWANETTPLFRFLTNLKQAQPVAREDSNE